MASKTSKKMQDTTVYRSIASAFPSPDRKGKKVSTGETVKDRRERLDAKDTMVAATAWMQRLDLLPVPVATAFLETLDSMGNSRINYAELVVVMAKYLSGPEKLGTFQATMKEAISNGFASGAAILATVQESSKNVRAMVNGGYTYWRDKVKTAAGIALPAPKVTPLTERLLTLIEAIKNGTPEDVEACATIMGTFALAYDEGVHEAEQERKSA